MKNTRLIGILITVAVLLLIPFVSMQTGIGGARWSKFDFILAGLLLLVTGLACEFVLRMVTSFKYRLAICAAILFVLFIIWAEIAVGLFGTPLAGS